MRKDVKIGLVLSLVLVVLAGWYYGRPKDDPAAIALDDAQTMAKRLAEKQPARVQALPPQEPESPRLSTPADRLNPDSSGQRAQSKPTPQRATPPYDQAAKGDLEQAKSNETDAESPAIRTGSRPGESTQLDVLDKMVQSKTVKTERTNAADRPQMQGPAPAGDDLGAMERHHVRFGDTLNKLADIYYGDEKLVSLLAKANPELPLSGPLPEGAMVRIPSRENNEHDFSDREIKAAPAAALARSKRNAADSGPMRTYKVKDGDSFYTIAANELGAASRWPELYDINKEVVGNDPNRLRAGQLLKLPASQ